MKSFDLDMHIFVQFCAMSDTFQKIMHKFKCQLFLFPGVQKYQIITKWNGLDDNNKFCVIRGQSLKKLDKKHTKIIDTS